MAPLDRAGTPTSPSRRPVMRRCSRRREPAPRSSAPSWRISPASARIVVARPHEAMLRVLPELLRCADACERSPRDGRSSDEGRRWARCRWVRVVIGRDVVLGDRVTLDAGTVVGDEVRIGDDSHLYANVSVYPRARIGRRWCTRARGSEATGSATVPGRRASEDPARRALRHQRRCGDWREHDDRSRQHR